MNKTDLSVAVVEYAAFEQVMVLVRFLSIDHINPIQFKTSFTDSVSNESVSMSDVLTLSGDPRLKLLAIAQQLAWSHAGPLLQLGIEVDVSELPPPSVPAPVPTPVLIPTPSPV